MKGIVLCGGESKRMGADKGLLKQGNTTWVEIAVSNLSSLQASVIISVNEKQIDLYSQIISANQLVVDNESLSIKGPLLGLLSVHQQFPGEDLLVVACDMINMQKLALQSLATACKEETFDAYVFAANEKIQPLCGIYTSRGLKHILDRYFEKRLKRFSMMYVLECLDTKYISADAFSECFINYNSVEDIAMGKSIDRVS